MEGFLGTRGTFSADVNLIVQLAMGLALIAGWLLARRRRYKAHAACQTSIVLLNLLMIALVMWPSFRAQVAPGLVRHWNRRYYAMAAAHGALGIAAELLGIYILLVAGTNIVPPRLRFNRWRVWMRVELVLWWVVVIMGIGVYYVWYVAS